MEPRTTCDTAGVASGPSYKDPLRFDSLPSRFDSCPPTLQQLHSPTHPSARCLHSLRCPALSTQTWGAYWTQNSYGTAMTTLPFIGDLTFKGMRESQNWWFNNMADGTQPYGGGAQGWAPDGCGCDNGEPSGCNYKQGDGNVPIHDWTLEETLSGLVMQSELLLISRNMSAIIEFLPKALRTSNLIEGRRDAATGMQTFLSGPSSNLLAPSFGGWTLDNGRHAWSYMTGISVTYSGALKKLIELCKMVGDNTSEALYSARLALNLKGLPFYLAPEGDYFVRSVDPNGTLHGVLGQDRHGYFEASPNHDAVALRVVDDELSRKIVTKIKSLGSLIRPNVFILPNTDAHGKPSVTGAGGVGYDDMACGNGTSCGGIFEFGTWVNGGVWTTTEGRWLMAAARVGDLAPARASVKQMIALFASTWRMDNPLVNFGLSPYQPNDDINLTIDNFASAGGLLRGLFEYLYSASTLTFIPHLPDNITAYSQQFSVRWGPYRIQLATVGVASSGIGSVSVNGAAATGHTINATSLTLNYGAMPVTAPAALAAVNSSISTASTSVTVVITFKTSAASSSTNSGGDAPPLANRREQPRPTPPGRIYHFSAATVPAGTLPGDNVTDWPSLVVGGPALSYPCPSLNATGPVTPPVFVNGTLPGLVFNGRTSFLCAAGPVPATKTFLAVFRSNVAPAIFSMVVGGSAGGFNGIGVSPLGAGVQVDIDWIGSTDQEHQGTNVLSQLVVATITYDTVAATSYVSGCPESTAGNVAGASPLGLSVGGRDDGGYGRYFNGTLHELMVFNRSLASGERAWLEQDLAARWGVVDHSAHCQTTFNCSTLAGGPPVALMTRLQAFAKATANPPLNSTLAHTMATVALSYVAAADTRCNGMNKDSIPLLRSKAASSASLSQLMGSANSVATGLENHLSNTAARMPNDPVAVQLIKIWNSSAV